MEQFVKTHRISVDPILFDFVNAEALPGTDLDGDRFWSALAAIIDNFAPQNKSLLLKRDKLQSQIDAWHAERRGNALDLDAYRSFLSEIGYMVAEGGDFEVATANVDPKLSAIAGPRLVVPLTNARYALNAANARWGSLYDALYGTDAIPETCGAERGGAFNPVRGRLVIDYARSLLDLAAPLDAGSHRDSTAYTVEDGELVVALSGGKSHRLSDPATFAGYVGDAAAPTSSVISNHGLHVDIVSNRDGPIGRDDAAGIDDALLESAVTTIMDCEDSVAAVDGEDKVLVYRNWLGLMRRDLTASFEKGGETVARRLNEDRRYTAPDGSECVLPGRSTMLVRNVSDILKCGAVLDANGDPVPEGILDAVITSLIAKHDLSGPTKGGNSRTGSVYIVKPKMHGSEEVAAAAALFAAVEDALDLAPLTLKMGIMDEERRTTVNLKECI
ncbi:MAG: malate synthase G, partial [Pseudomonadota bacterium]|nr:malate synthase G [Pseudomonadota bacterium]